MLVTEVIREEKNFMTCLPYDGLERWQAQKRYVDLLLVKPKTFLIQGLEHCSDECKVLEYFDAKYAKDNPKKNRRSHTVPRKIINRQQEHNYIVNMWWMKYYYMKHKI